jgi:hypothetical protein
LYLEGASPPCSFGLLHTNRISALRYSHLSMQVTLSDAHYRFLGKPFPLAQLVSALDEIRATSGQ